MLKQIALIAVAMVMVLSAVSVASADVNLPSNAVKVGNFVLSENTTTGAVYNLSFVNDNYEAAIASSVNATGNTVLKTGLSQFNTDNLKNMGNLTVFTAGNENTMFLATQAVGSAASITMHLDAPVTKVNLTAAQKIFLQDHSGAIASSFLANNMYRISVNNTAFIIFASQNLNVANGTTNLTFVKSSGLLFNGVIVGVSSASALKDTIEKEVGQHGGFPFSYNNTTGAVRGRFVSLDFNTSSGVMSNYMQAQGNSTVFTSISASGNGTIGVNNPSPVYPTLQPIVAGNVFFYGNNTVVYQIHNNPSLVSNFYLSNGSLTFAVANGLNVSTYKPVKTDVGHEDLNSSSVNYTGVSLGDQYDVPASSTIVFIHNSTFKGSLFVHGAGVSVNNTTGTITLSTNGTAKVSFVAPPGLQDLKSTVRDAVQYAIDHGKLAALVVLGGPGNASSNLSVNYNNTMGVQIQNVKTGSVTVKVNSTLHEGTNFAIFVPNGVISNNSRITLTFDSQTITLSKTLGSVVNATSTTQATFYYVSVNGGTLVVVHVPHFSTHTIQISTASSTTGNTGFPSLTGQNGIYLAVGIAAVIAVIAGVSLARRRK